MSRWDHSDLATALANNPDLRVNRPRNGSRNLNPQQPAGVSDAPSEPLGGKKQGRSKYRNRKTEVLGITFDSKKEAARYVELKALEQVGKIRSLARQRKFPLEVNKVKICDYVCDFEYFELGPDGVWEWIVEDVKSAITRKLAAYRYKKRLMLAIWRVEIRET